MSRPAYDNEAARLGRITEEKMMQYLHRVHMLDYWFNAFGESGEVDFRLRDMRYLECERKDKKYEQYLGEGLDFLYEKVEKYKAWEKDVMYAIVLSHHRYFYVASCKDIATCGKLIQKDTTREKGEWFYRMPLWRCKRVDMFFEFERE